MAIHTAGPRLLSSVPFKHLGGKGKHGSKSVTASLNLTAFVDMMTILVTFLLMTFSASGEMIVYKGLELPDATNKSELKFAPIVAITKDTVTFNGDQVADVRSLEAENSMEWKILDLHERLKAEKTAFELQPMEEEKRKELRGFLVLQADKSVDAKILNRVMKTAYAAEYPNIMFAINQRSAGGGGGH